MSNRNLHYGPQIGDYMGRPIFESIQDQDGTFIFDRIANRIDDDGYPLDQLGKNERLFQPGLIYKQKP